MYTVKSDEFPRVCPEGVRQTARASMTAIAYMQRGAAIWPSEVQVTLGPVIEPIRPCWTAGGEQNLARSVLLLVAPGARPEAVVAFLRTLGEAIERDGLYAGCTSDGEVMMALPEH